MLKLFEKVFAGVMLSFACGGFTHFFDTGHRLNFAESRPGAFMLQFALYAVACILFLLNARRIWIGIVKTPWILLLVAFTIASTAWSQDPAITLRRSLVAAATVLYGVHFGSRFEIGEQVRLLAVTLLVILGLSAIAAVLLPNYGLDTGLYAGNWRGLFVQKNALGRVAVLGAITFRLWTPRFSLLRRLAFLFAIFITVMSRSATGILVLVILLLLPALFRVVKLPLAVSVPIIIGLFLVVGVLASNMDAILALLGRDSTLTGRVGLWRAVFAAIGEHPILGYGFRAFWLGIAGNSAPIILAVHWIVEHSHNGILDMWLDLGAIGVFLFLAAYISCVVDAVRFYTAEYSREKLWPLIYLSFLCLYNLTESTAFQENSIFVILFVAIAARLAMTGLRGRRPVFHPALTFDVFVSIPEIQSVEISSNF